MDDYPRWDELGLLDRLRIASLEAELAGVADPFLDAMHAAADLLEQLTGASDRGSNEVSEGLGIE
jgi:hypothetical protein